MKSIAAREKKKSLPKTDIAILKIKKYRNGTNRYGIFIS